MGINAQVLSLKFPGMSVGEIEKYSKLFASRDKTNTGSLKITEFPAAVRESGENFPSNLCNETAQAVDKNGDGLISFEEFLSAITKLREGPAGRAVAIKKIHSIQGSNENITHSISDDEKESFTQHINDRLQGDKDLGARLPIDTSGMQLFAECRDGILLSKLINDSVPGTIDDRVLNRGAKALSPFQVAENNNVVINSAKAIGCNVVNIGSQDLVEGKEHLILGLIWQIIRIGLNAKIDIRIHPELFRLLEAGETIEDLLKLPPEQILLRWFNYHLKKAGWARKVNNFSGDVKDSENYTVLLAQLIPEKCNRDALKETDLHKRAEMVLEASERIGCRKYVTAKTICSGNSKLNFAYVANLFNTHPGLEPLDEQQKGALDDWLFNSQGDREARAFALWMNSLGVEPFVNNLFEDLRNGCVLLQTYDKIHPGMVEWKRTNKAPITSKFKKVENTNYAVVLGKSLKFSLVGIQGADITDGSKTLTLGLVWQMMRDHILTTLKTLSSAGGKEIKDEDIIRWANDTVKRGGQSTSISNFKDSTLKNGTYLLDLCNGIKKGIVDYKLIVRDENEDAYKLNAKYAISLARKMGATIFVLPEDIVEVKPKMIMTFVGTLMAVDRQVNGAAAAPAS